MGDLIGKMTSQENLMKHGDMHCINESQNMRTLDIQILQIPGEVRCERNP